MKVSQRGISFHRSGPRSNPYRMMVWGAFIVTGLIVLGAIGNGQIQPLFLPTPTPTRSAPSFREEGAAFFEAGNLDAAIQAYGDALEVAPNDYRGWAELARIQAYSSSLLTLDRKRDRLAEARASIDRAVELAPDDGYVHAVRAFVLDWSAGASGNSTDYEVFLAEASTEAIRAVLIDNQSAIVLAYRAEIYADQAQLTQAFQYAELALAADPNSFDARRVYAYVLEANGDYGQAIDQYRQAAEIAPNLTFLYISIGQNYRQLGLYDQALEYFDQAASINLGLGINDPLPYVAIAKTYSRMGEFFAAALNAERAIEFDPTNPDLYGQLGVVYFRSRNYEGSIPALKCAVIGCTGQENPIVGCPPSGEGTPEASQACTTGIAVSGSPLDNDTLVYYYTYGSVLAALDQCDLAIPILDQLRAAYSGDELVMGIVNENYNVCENLAAQN